ncbi:MAG: FAD:protein FMN transferase, partial [Acetatifactor sp.]
GAVISVGGSVLTYGEKPDGDSWRVGILNPFDTSENLGYLSLTGQWCISTSGDYERFVEVDGIRYHHIIDPATGYPAQSGVSSVTVLTKDGLLSDALSTACFVLGVEKGSRLAEEFDAEVLFVDKSGEMHMSKGMEEYFHLSK